MLCFLLQGPQHEEKSGGNAGKCYLASFLPLPCFMSRAPDCGFTSMAEDGKSLTA